MKKKPSTAGDLHSIPAACSGGRGGLAGSVFEQAVSQAELAISITDPHANIVYVNPTFSRVTGYTAAEALGHNESILSNQTTPPAVYRELWQHISRGKPWSGRLVNRRKDGRKYLAELTITPVVDASGSVVNYLGMHRDVTEMHRLECQVRNQKALIESVVDGAPMVLALLDADDKVVLDNHAYKALMADLDMAEPAALLLASVRAENSSEGAPREGYAFLDREVRIEGRAAEAPRWFSCSGVWVKEDDDRADAFFAGAGRAYLLLVATETTRLRLQQEKARMATLQAMMADEERINALRESLSAAVFQLEGPLNMIASAVGMLSRRSAGDPMAAALAEAVQSGSAALEKLRAMIPPQQVEAATAANVNELVRSVLDLATPRLLAEGISVAWTPQAVLPAVRGYPRALLALFKSLIDNAIDAMSLRGWRERELTVTTRALLGNIEVLIEDSGPGIPSALQLKVFEPFFTTRQGQGRHMGTGLAIAQQAAVDHGGTISIDPDVSRGCRVRVVLPVSR
ncbi:MAG: nitrogen fixation negative regulator NifL [Rhodocyclaceae bacterium]|jgi:nitrogen fixation negative regulator NifL|nr:nitrogen fixation negative regulator NifL [Rhodocyclaceae bacterium]